MMASLAEGGTPKGFSLELSFRMALWARGFCPVKRVSSESVRGITAGAPAATNPARRKALRFIGILLEKSQCSVTLH
jgi:hypothetical protein